MKEKWQENRARLFIFVLSFFFLAKAEAILLPNAMDVLLLSVLSARSIDSDRILFSSCACVNGNMHASCR